MGYSRHARYHQADGRDRQTDREPVLLARLPVDGFDWSEHLPPVPRGHVVTVSFTDPAASAHHAPVLAQLGYSIVDEVRSDVADPAPGRVAAQNETMSLIVYGTTADSHPTWWRAVSALADHIYPLRLGPPAAHWAELVSAHLARLEHRGG